MNFQITLVALISRNSHQCHVIRMRLLALSFALVDPTIGFPFPGTTRIAVAYMQTPFSFTFIISLSL
ncbi:hypothetical protein L6452_06845 [Arctium lappa]|uniref:Uncharacterized protein n=1 Tax=Arctium lappa TaxID=4217 RepID=A0ACB9EJW1_ARCLA|nr:hypothetical protein L6452_06845 [Arctium lappa]